MPKKLQTMKWLNSSKRPSRPPSHRSSHQYVSPNKAMGSGISTTQLPSVRVKRRFNDNGADARTRTTGSASTRPSWPAQTVKMMASRLIQQTLSIFRKATKQSKFLSTPCHQPLTIPMSEPTIWHKFHLPQNRKTLRTTSSKTDCSMPASSSRTNSTVRHLPATR